eukprot:scaffold113974_cov62-Attheya_sp.AAC.1
MLQGEYMLDFAHVFARALNNVAHVGARTRNSRTFYVANVPAYGIAVCLFVCLFVCLSVCRSVGLSVRTASVRRRMASVRHQGGLSQF